MTLSDFPCQCCKEKPAEPLELQLTMAVLAVGLDALLERTRLEDRLLCSDCKEMKEAINSIGHEVEKGSE